MNKFRITALSVAVLCCFLASCCPFRYENIFGLKKSLLSKGKYLKNGYVIILNLKKEEFERLKPDMEKKGLENWKRMPANYPVFSRDFKYSNPKDANVIYSHYRISMKYSDFAVAIYNYDNSTLYLIVADGMGG